MANQMKSIIESYNKKDYETFFDALDENVKITHPAFPETANKNQFKEYVHSLDKSFSDIEAKVTTEIISGDHSSTEIIWNATHKESNKRVQNPQCWIMRWENNKVVESRTYFDTQAVNKQLE